MARQQRISYGIDFEVNKKGLQDIMEQLNKIKSMTKIEFAEVTGKSPTTVMVKEMQQVQSTARKVESALKTAFNPKINSVNIQTFKAELAKSGKTLQSVQAEFAKMGVTGTNAYRSLHAELTKFNTQVKKTNTLLNKLGTTLTNTIKWNISSSLMNGVTQSIQQAWGFAKNLDSSLNDIRVVTGKSADEMARFAERANAVASNLGKGTTDYTKAALIYAQQGLGDKEVESRTAVTLKAANVTGQSTEAVSEELTAVWNGYKASAEQAELYVDRLAAVASTTASNLQELSTGMSKVASAAAAMGVGEEQLAAQLSTIISVTKQAPESVGTALRTVYARITDIKAGVEEDGTTLGQYSGKMAQMGINVLDAAGNLRDMGTVMEEIGAKWGTMTREQQVYLAQTMAGQRQYSNLVALFDNFDKYNSALKTAQEAEGTLSKQNDIHMESLNAHLQKLTTATEEMWMNLTDTDGIKGLVDGLTSIIQKVDKLFKSLGGGKALLNSLGAISMRLVSGTVAKSLSTTLSNRKLAQQQQVENKEKAANAGARADKLAAQGKTDTEEYKLERQKQQFFSKKQGTFSKQQMEAINQQWDKAAQGANKRDSARDVIKKSKSAAAIIGEEITGDNIEERDNSRKLIQNELIKTADEIQDANIKVAANEEELAESIKALSDIIRKQESEIEKNNRRKADLQQQLNKNSSLSEEEKQKKRKQIAGIEETNKQHQENIDKAQSRKDFLTTSTGSSEENIIDKEKIRIRRELQEQEKQNQIDQYGRETYDQLMHDSQLEANGLLEGSQYTNEFLELDKIINEVVSQKIKEKEKEIEEQAKKAAKSQTEQIVWEGTNSNTSNSGFLALQNNDTSQDEQFIAIQKQYRELVNAIEEYNNEVSNITQKTADDHLQELGEEKQKILDAINEVSNKADEYFRTQGENVEAGGQGERQQQEGQQQQKKAQQTIDDESYRVSMQQGLQAAMNLAGGLAQVQAGFQSLMSIGDIWADDTLTNTEKLSQTFSNMLMTIPMIFSGFTAVAGAIKTLAKEETLAAAVQSLLTKQLWANTAGLKANTVALLTNIGTLVKKVAVMVWESLGPWGLLAAAIGAVIAITAAVADAQKKAAQAQIKANEKLLEQEKKKQEEIKHNQDIISEVQALNKSYEDGIITRQELKEKTQELQQKYQEESAEIRNLISDYNNLGEAAKNAKEKQLEKMSKSKADEAKTLGQNIDLKLTGQHKTQDDFLGGIFTSGFGALGAKAQGNAVLQTGVGGNDANFANTVGNLLEEAGLGKTNSGIGGNYIELFNAKNKEEARNQIEILQQAVENASDADKQTDTYRNIQAILEEMSPMLQEWKSANLQSLNLIAEQEANRQANNFNNINDFAEYEAAYQKTSKAIYQQMQANGQLKGMSDDEINDIIARKTEAIIPKDLKTQYGNKMDVTNRINHWNGAGYFGLSETDDEILKLVDGLSEDQLSKFLSFDIKDMQDLEDVKRVLQTISEYDFKNLNFNNADAKKAAQTYNNMANALQKISNSKAISTKDFEENYGFSDEIKSYFRMGNNGYVLKDASKKDEVKQLIKQQQRSGWDEKYRVQQNIEENETAWINSDANGYNYQVWDSGDNLANAQQMINKLKTIDDKQVKTQLAVYEGFVKDGEISQEKYEKIYNYFDELSKKHKEAANKIKQANEQQQEALQQIHESIFPMDNDVDETLVAKLGEQFQLTAKKSELLDDALESNAKKVRDIAEEVQRYNVALSSVIKNYATWQDKLSGSTADKLSVALQIKDAMADTLGISETILSDTFATTKQNLEDMRLALEGDEKAYKRLQQAAYNDILLHVGLDDAELNEVQILLENYFKGLDLDVAVGAELDQAALETVLAELIKKGIDTEQQLEAIFAAKGVDLDVVVENGKAEILSYTKAATHELKQQEKSQEELKNLERDRIKNQKELTKFLKDERDIYHEINRLLSDQERTIKRITRNQQDMYGTELLDNLNAESAEYEKQQKLLKSKQKMQQQDLADKRAKLRSSGAEFDANGNVSNYNNLIGNAMNTVNEIISRERGIQEAMNQHLLNGGNTSDEAYKDLELKLTEVGKEKSQANDYLNDLKTDLSNYEKVKDEAEDVADQLTEISEKQIEINLKKFNMKLEVTLDLSQATKIWNDYKRNVLQHDDIFNPNRALSAQKDNAQRLADINADSQSLDVVNQQIEKAMADNGTLYKTQGQKKKAIEELQKKAIQLRKGILENEDAIKQTYLEQYDIISEMFEKQKSQYDFVNNQLEHNKNMMTLVFGENDYAAQNVYNNKMIENNLKSIESMNNRVQIAEENLQKAKESGNTAVIEAAEQEWKTAIQNRNQLEEQSAQLLKDRYTTAINQIAHQMEQKLTNNKGFNYMDTQWDLMKKQSNLYLDDINSAFAIKNTEYLYNQALNDTKGLKSQQQLKKVMSEQLDILKEKDKLTQYDVNRAQKVLEIEKARIALEQARNNKTQMRLKRDSQGNYSYQYVADQDNIAKAKNDLQKAENDLYNFDKDNYENKLKEAYDATKEYQEKITALEIEYATATEERRKQIDEEKRLLDQQYSEYILNLSQETEWGKQNLMESTMMNFTDMMNQEQLDFENMSDAQKEKWLGDMVPSINTGIAEMIGKFSTDPDSFKQIIIDATQAMDNERKTYQQGLADLQKAAGQNWNNIKKAMDPVVELQNELIIDNDKLKKQAEEIVTAMNGTLTALDTQKTKWGQVYSATNRAVRRVYDYISAIDKAALKKLDKDENKGNKGNKGDTENPPPTIHPGPQTGGTTGTPQPQPKPTPSPPRSRRKTKTLGVKEETKNSETEKLRVVRNYKVRQLPLFDEYQKLSDSDKQSQNGLNMVAQAIAQFNARGNGEFSEAGFNHWQRELQNHAVDEYNRFKFDKAMDYFEGQINKEYITIDLTPKKRIVSQWETLIQQCLAIYGKPYDKTELTEKDVKTWWQLKDIQESGLTQSYGSFENFWKEFKRHKYSSEQGVKYQAFSTGGYTGDWSSTQGKLAVLHQKELVLNKQDTANLLDTIQALRDIYTMNTIQSQITSMLESLNEQAKIQKERVETLKQQKSLQQQVSISASFPGVTNKNEIEAAFNELINKATQATLKNKK